MVEFGVHVQQIYNVKSQTPMYYEVLARAYKGVKGADAILKHVHENNKCREFDEDMISLTLDRIRDIMAVGYTYAFNICDKTFEEKGEAERILDIIKSKPVADDIIIEVTEDTDFTNENVIENIETLRKNGIKVALDDFGKSNAGIESLINVQFDIVKIDKDYMLQSIYNKKAKKVLAGVVEMLNSLGVAIVVEGVETAQHYNTAMKLGIDNMQGYYIEKPHEMGSSIIGRVAWA